MISLKEIMDRAAFALSVPKCVCCRTRLNYGEKAFCPVCSAEFDDFCTRNCSKCAKLLHECSCSNAFLESHFIKRVVKCYRYFGYNKSHPSTSLIFSLKQDNRRDVLELSTKLLVNSIRNSIEKVDEYIVTNIPRREKAIIEYGIDHSALLATEIAKELNIEYLQILKSKAKLAQKTLDPSERRKNAEFDYIIEPNLSGKKIILVDDIITSGASMANAAILLRALGAREIVAACLAIAYFDS